MKLRAHPLGIGVASVQFEKLNSLVARRKAYVEAIEQRLEQLPGLRPVQVYPRAERGGYYAFPIIHDPEQHHGLTTQELVHILRQEGLNASTSPYESLHRLKIFSEGFDIFTRGRGPLCGDYPGYRKGDFPATEAVVERLIFVPMLSDPLPGAVEKVAMMLEKAVKRAMAPRF
jgi:dTDP-4-amino-4,6-dideoxygalactose transaminase